MLVVAGDALVDMVGDADYTYRAHPGGSCFNVAMALGRLGVEVGFASPLSGDALGRLLGSTLERSGVRLLVRQPAAAPTPLAVVSIDADGRPTYAFYRERTADRTVTAAGLVAALPPSPRVYHVGSLALIGPDDSGDWLAGARAARDRGAVVSIDPNVRPSLIDDLDDYRRRMEDALALADIVKLSDEDLAVLDPDQGPRAAFEALCTRHRPAAAILTLGEDGAVGMTRGGSRVEQSAFAVGPIVDTIGAGDSLQAGFLWSLDTAGLLDRGRIPDIAAKELERAMRAGGVAAGINCTRAGADPPWLRELVPALSSSDGQAAT